LTSLPGAHEPRVPGGTIVLSIKETKHERGVFPDTSLRMCDVDPSIDQTRRNLTVS